MLLDYQSFIRSDRDGAVRFLVSAARDLQGTSLAELAIRMALTYEVGQLSSSSVGEAEARRILTVESELSPEFRDIARRFLARTLTASGRREEAMDLHRRRGLVLSWLIAGPAESLGNYNSPDFPATGEIITRDVIATPPDAADFRDWRQAPPWRPLPENRAFPFVRPWRGYGGSTDGGVLLLTGLEMAAADNEAYFHILADISWRLLVDGAVVAEVDKNNEQAPAEHRVPYALTPGRHTAVLQLSPPHAGVLPERARAALRLESSAQFHWTVDVDKPEAGTPENARRPARRLRFLDDLQEAAGDNPILTAAYAVALAEQRMADEGSWWAESAARAQAGDDILQLLAGTLVSHNPLLPAERRRELALAWHRGALAANPEIVPSLLFLAGVATEMGKIREAHQHLAAAYAINPTSLDVLVARAEWASSYASGATIRQAWEECGRAFPQSPTVQIAIASMPEDGFMDMNRRLEAARMAAEAGPYDADAHLILANALADSGNAQEAEAALRQARQIFNGDVSAQARIARVYARLGLYDQAIETHAQAVRTLPTNADLWRELGDLRMESGDEEGALEDWRVSLAARPGQYNLADMADYLSGRPDAGYQDGAYDAIAMTSGADPDDYSGDVVRLLDRSVVIFSEDGSYRRITHEIDLARTRRGGETLSRIESQGEILTARIVFPNGNTLEPEPYPGQGGLRLPVLMPGAARELKTMESVPADQAVTSLRPWFFQDPTGGTAFLLSELVVIAPRNFPLVHVTRDLGQPVEFEFRQDGERDHYRWSAALGTSRHEPDAVHVSERIPSVEVGMRTSWEDVGRRRLRELDGRLMPSMRMRTLLNRLYPFTPDDRPDPMRAARAIYRYVCDNIDPTPISALAAHVHVDRMGDRNLLLLALLRAAGLDAHPAAARPNIRAMPPPAWELPNASAFPIDIVRLDIPGGQPVWLDTRFDSLPFGFVADDLSGATVFSLLPSGPLFETLPQLPAEQSLLMRERTIRLPGKGETVSSVSGGSLRRGVAGLVRLRQYDEAEAIDRRRMIISGLYPIFPDAVLQGMDIMRPADDEAAFRLRYDVTTRMVTEPRGDGVIAANLCLQPPTIISAETQNQKRRLTVCHIDSVRISEDHNTFILPDGAVFTSLPKPVQIPSRFGLYQLRVNPRGTNGVEVVRTYHVPAQRIQPWDWADFLRFLDRIGLAEKQWLEYRIAE